MPMLKFLDMFRKSRGYSSESPEKSAFQVKYKYYQSLLAGNNKALEAITALEGLCYGIKPFTLDTILADAETLVSVVYDIAEDLNALSGGSYEGLFDSVERIGVKVLRGLAIKKEIAPTALTIPLSQLSLERSADVGGKAANLGEVKNRVHLPVPEGFSVSAYACDQFLRESKLYKLAEDLFKGLDIENTDELESRCFRIQKAIMEAQLPEGLAGCITQEYGSVAKRLGRDPVMAVRSSATSEDSEASFAGQHATVLGVRKPDILTAYKEVVASTFSPRAVYYRRSKGYPDEEVVMSVLFLEMVPAVSAGVMYSRDPSEPTREDMPIDAVWGLGVAVVDGSEPTDFFRVARLDERITEKSPTFKTTRMIMDEAGGIREERLPENMRAVSCLTDDQLVMLGRYATTLETHYGQPQDIEWALDPCGTLVVLQSRPLGLEVALPTERPYNPHTWAAENPEHPILAKGGMTASRGKAAGLAYYLASEHNLAGVPEGAILIAPQTSPNYVPILGRLAAIVTEVGSVTGHMASVAREFGVPTLVGVPGVCTLIAHGSEITVDATNNVVFSGRVEKILERKRPTNPMKGSPTYKAAHAALHHIAMLTLTDPNKENFSPEGCQTLHDVVRFAHEKAMREMFSIAEGIDEAGYAVRLVLPLPMQVLVIDLGEGLTVPPNTPRAALEDVSSLPFKALLTGMLYQGLRWSGGVGVDWKGFACIVMESAMTADAQNERMGGPTYVLASRNYLNFNSRLGYHFAVIDSYVGESVNDNYVSFSFKGGAADIGRRSRRAALIAKVFKRLGFKVESQGDMVKAVIKKYDQNVLTGKLETIGRLLGSVRLLDMVLSDDGSIDWYVEQFFAGNYTFDRKASSPQPG